MQNVRPTYLNVQLYHQFFIVVPPNPQKMDSRLKHLERKQKLYSLLKMQHDAEMKELMHYMSVLPTVENNLVRSYIHALLSDGLRHIEYISRIMAEFEGATRSASLTKKGIQESIKDEQDSRDALLKCAEMADDPETAALLKSISVDEEHHIRILQHLAEIIKSS
jgi:rubrerythrin